MSGAQTTKYQKSLKANKLKSKIKNKVKKKYNQLNEVDPVTGGYRYGGMNPKSQAGKKTGRGNQGKLKKFWDDWLFPQD
jgi:hypothetical protein